MSNKTKTKVVTLVVYGLMSLVATVICFYNLIGFSDLKISQVRKFDVHQKLILKKTSSGDAVKILFDESGLKYPIINHSYDSKNDLIKLIKASRVAQNVKYSLVILEGKEYACNIVIEKMVYFSYGNVNLALARKKLSAWFLFIGFLLTTIMCSFGIHHELKVNPTSQP